MKKIGIVLIVALVSAGGLFAQDGILRESRGQVEVKLPNASQWSDAQSGMVLPRGTTISTGFQSSALIALGESLITVRPLTRLSLEQIAAQGREEQVSLSLQAGQIRASVKKPEGGNVDFTVRSPSATASVRGTEFEMNTLQAWLYEGMLLFAGLGFEDLAVLLYSGDYSSIDLSGLASSPYWEQILALITSLPIGTSLANLDFGQITLPEVPEATVDIGVEW